MLFSGCKWQRAVIGLEEYVDKLSITHSQAFVPTLGGLQITEIYYLLILYLFSLCIACDRIPGCSQVIIMHDNILSR